ncbi:MAG: bifunctional precorrin-2 dehydrogenase/sirohydrochlorin ferrochelatase [Akkermansiaceae bacterium]|nr:bifunctional precorrin-2 dehydrogenase/sirohydrochlorin ferrochelatase [Armatimonadota bacterium]
MSENIPNSENRFLYPVALDVRGRRCLVVGGGTVGARKAMALADAGAAVTIVAPELCADALILVNDEKAQHTAEPFVPDHLEDAFLVVVATDSPAVNADVSREARRRGVLVNMAAPGDESDTDSGDFATMATVRRGDLLLAVTTGGAGPALSAQIRRELSARFGEEWEPTVSLLSEMRVIAKTEFTDPERRMTVLRRVAGKADHFAALYKNGDGETARKEAFACLSL